MCDASRRGGGGLNLHWWQRRVEASHHPSSCAPRTRHALRTLPPKILCVAQTQAPRRAAPCMHARTHTCAALAALFFLTARPDGMVKQPLSRCCMQHSKTQHTQSEETARFAKQTIHRATARQARTFCTLCYSSEGSPTRARAQGCRGCQSSWTPDNGACARERKKKREGEKRGT